MTSTIRFENLSEDSSIRLLDGKNVTHEFPVHVHDSYTLGVVIRGERYIQVGRQDYLIREGEGFFINPLVPHSCGSAAENGHDYQVVSLETDLMKAAARDVFGRDCLPCFSCIKLSNDTLIIRLINMLKKNDQSDLPDHESLLSLLYDLISLYADDANPAQISESREKLAKQARAYMDAHLQQNISLEELAKETNVSPYYVDRVFREVIGVPPHVYQLQTRIKKAVDALLKTGSIVEASYYFGFSDQSHFSRIFKKNMGVSPGRFMRTNRKRTR
jgi:AraC-like DNA-binding protein